MHQLNLTAISLGRAGHCSSRWHWSRHPFQTLLLFFFFSDVVRNQTNCKSNHSWSTLTAYIPPVQSVQCSKLPLTKELQSHDSWAGNTACAGAKRNKMKMKNSLHDEGEIIIKTAWSRGSVPPRSSECRLCRLQKYRCPTGPVP